MAGLRLARENDPNITATDLAMMERAIALASKAAAIGEVPVGAVVYKGDRIVAEASNNREATRDPVGHAELLAMSAAGKVLGDWRLTEWMRFTSATPMAWISSAVMSVVVCWRSK